MTLHPGRGAEPRGIIHAAYLYWLDTRRIRVPGRHVAHSRAIIVFLLQSIVVGLAVAFLVVLVRPDLMPGVAAPVNGAASYADAVDRSAASVANIYTKRLVQDNDAPAERPRFRIDTSFASAVIIDSEGLLATNYHVIADATEIRLQLSDGRIIEPDIVGVDAETDLALLKVDAGPLPAITMGNSSQLRIGDVVLAIGNPYGLTTSVTQGIVSATGRGLLNLVTFENFIQTDAAINAGNSGGALVNSRGELVGINTAVLAQDTSTEGIGFAIPVDLVRGVVEQIRQNGRVIRGYMGLVPDDLTSAERTALGVDSDVGILLVEVYEDGPAAAAGLRRGDVILDINGAPVFSQRQALLISASTIPGDIVDVIGIRDGQRFSVQVIAGERPDEPR
ncbi:MAG: trypsin-like peptidase domain-containing protein [Gammaproteobacteria bacterium]|nr:trypsin-like peptidase domain-containing protein [Gammaproteobacteria bacterium]